MHGCHIRPVLQDDRPLVRSLFEQVFGPWPGDAFWGWKYSECEQGQAHAWLLLDPQTLEPLAHLGARTGIGRAPWGMSTVAQVMDVMVHPKARGQRLFETLLEAALRSLYEQDRNLFVFGFAGIRPFRLGARQGFYRGIRAHHAAQPRGASPELQTLTQGHLAHIAAVHPKPDAFLGFLQTPGFLKWRYLAHPTRTYYWLPEPVGAAEHEQARGSVVTASSDGGVWSVASSLHQPDPRVWHWRSEPLVDKGYGAMQSEPMMVSGQITLPQLCSADHLTRFSFEPGQTDVF